MRGEGQCPRNQEHRVALSFLTNRGVIAKSGYNYREDPFEDFFAARGLRDAALNLRLAFPLRIKWL